MLCLCLTGISQHRLVTNQWACGVEAHQWGKVPVPWVGRAAHFAHAARAAPAAHAARAAPAACAARTACAAKVLATLGAQQGSPLCQHHTGLGSPSSWRPGTWQLLYSPAASSQCQSYPGYFEISYLVFEKGCLSKSKSEVLGTPDSQRL